MIDRLGRTARMIAVALAIAVGTAGVGAPRLEAMIAPAHEAAAMVGSDRSADLALVQKTLQQKVIRQRLHDYGLSDVEIDRRLNRLSDAQLHQVAMQIDKQAPAGDATGTVLGVALIVLLIVVILKLIDDID